MENRKVWCLPQQETDFNLNQTVVRSEKPLTKVTFNNLFESGQLGSTDFLTSDYFDSIFGIDHYKENYILSSKISSEHALPPREDVFVASSSNHQTSDQSDIQTLQQEAGSPEVVLLSKVQTLSASSSNVNELEPKDKEQQKPVVTVQPIKRVGQTQPEVNVFSILEECGLIECREEVVDTQSSSRVCHQYTSGKIVHGDSRALESLAKDCAANKLKHGTHGVITDPRYNFLRNPNLTSVKEKVLGGGGNGTVDLCRFNDVYFVTKTIFHDFRQNEVLFTNSLSHEFIVKSHGLIVRNGSPQIIMDYAGDNLLHYGLSRVLYENKIWNITFQILEALNYLHSKQIRHFDVKPENIVLFEDSTGHLTIKLADFGGATYFSEEVDCLSWTPAYMSPEMDQFYLNRQFPGLKLIPTSCGKITEKCDVYSLALSILFIYVRGHVLIKHVTQGNQNMVDREKADAVSMQILIKNAKNPGLGQTLIPQNVGKDMRKLLLGMLAGNVDDRMTAKQAMEQMKALSCIQSANGICQQPKRTVQQKSAENKVNSAHSAQANRPKLPKPVNVTLDPKGIKLGEYHTTIEKQEQVQKMRRNGQYNIEMEEQQRPLHDLIIDLQLHTIMEQSKNVKDEKMRQVIDEENRPLLKRLVKRKLKDKVHEKRAFKMTKNIEELESDSSTSFGSGKVNIMATNMSYQQCSIVASPPEPKEMQCDDGPGNIPNFDMFLDM